MTIDEFIEKWENCAGSERSNYAVFLTQLTQALGVEAPGPTPDYCIDAPVSGGSAGGGTGFIDLYKSGHFILEAKQSKVCELPTLPGMDEVPEGKAGRYDELMRRAFRQARRYAQSLPDPPWPPFIITLDVGRAFEIYFDYAVARRPAALSSSGRRHNPRPPVAGMGRRRTLNAQPFKTVRKSLRSEINLKHPASRCHIGLTALVESL